jgi:AICAR transformylase/IMP cyclohydrolase PurH
VWEQREGCSLTCCCALTPARKQAGVAAIAHPGGSIRDTDAVECCNKYGVAIVTTGVRHFKH